MGDWTDVDAIEGALLKPTISMQESQALYNKWAVAGTYDQLVTNDQTLYGGLSIFYKALKGLFTNLENVRALDIGAGTGLTGEHLGKLGYKHIDAVEPCAEFVKILTQKKIYVKVVAQPIGGEKQIDIPDDTYDVVTLCDVFGPGHVPCSAIPEMIRIVKPGGYIVNCMREEYLWTVPEYKDRLEPLWEKCEKEGCWKLIKREVYPNHFHQKDGLLIIYQVC